MIQKFWQGARENTGVGETQTIRNDGKQNFTGFDSYFGNDSASGFLHPTTKRGQATQATMLLDQWNQVRPPRTTQ